MWKFGPVRLLIANRILILLLLLVMMTLGMLEDKQGEQRRSSEQVSERGLKRKMKTFVSNFVEHLMIDVDLGGRAGATIVTLKSAFLGAHDAIHKI